MFDEEQEKLLASSLAKVKADFHNNNKFYQVSGFDQTFDDELKQLVILYSFDFQAIAYHLYFKYPQYAHRLKPQAVSYRWFQLTMEMHKDDLGKQIPSSNIIAEGNTEAYESETMNAQQNYGQVSIFSLQEKLLQYQTAMLKAQELDEQQQQSFMLYKPKFIMDSEFKLQRETTEDAHNLEMLMQNQSCFEFGAFEPPLAAPLPEIVIDKENIPHLQKQAAPPIQQDTDYLDSDWQAYQSD